MTRPLTHARIDAPHLADGLFTITRGVEGRGRNRVVHTTWGELEIEFACVEPLGVAEQSVLLALVARAGIDGKRISANGKSERGKALHALLRASESAARDGIMLTTTISQLVADLGLTKSGTAYLAVANALRRLGNVVIWLRDRARGREANTLLLAVHRRGDTLDVAMNYRIRDALRGAGFTRVDLLERQVLTSDVARLLHAFLSRWIRPKGEREIAVDTLAKHVWTDGIGAHKTTRRDRRAAIRAALAEIAALDGWSVTEHHDTVEIGRLGRRENSTHRRVRIPPTAGEKTTHRASKRREPQTLGPQAFPALSTSPAKAGLRLLIRESNATAARLRPRRPADDLSIYLPYHPKH